MGVYNMRDSPQANTAPNQKWEVERLGFCIETDLEKHAITLSGKLFECPEVSAAIANAATVLGRRLSADWQVNVVEGFVANLSGIAAFRQIMSRFLVRCTYSEGFLAIEREHEGAHENGRGMPRNASLR